MFCAKAADRKSLHDGDVYECCVEYFSMQKNERKWALWITHSEDF